MRTFVECQNNLFVVQFKGSYTWRTGVHIRKWIDRPVRGVYSDNARKKTLLLLIVAFSKTGGAPAEKERKSAKRPKEHHNHPESTQPFP